MSHDTCHMSHVTCHLLCHVSCVMSHMSYVTCCVSHVTYISFSFFGHGGGTNWWRVFHQRGLPRLVQIYIAMLPFLLEMLLTQWQMPQKVIKVPDLFLHCWAQAEHYCQATSTLMWSLVYLGWGLLEEEPSFPKPNHLVPAGSLVLLFWLFWAL